MNLFEKGIVEIRASFLGKGLFATQNIPSGTFVCKITGTFLSFKETLLLGEKESHTLQVGMDEYILCSPPFLFSNHSCNPNCAVNANLEFFTLREIKENEELLWDYSTSMFERHWTMQCFCGSENCRYIIRDFDYLSTELQTKYLQMNIVFPFIVKQLFQNFAKGA
jgi:hypothetical protein